MSSPSRLRRRGRAVSPTGPRQHGDALLPLRGSTGADVVVLRHVSRCRRSAPRAIAQVPGLQKRSSTVNRHTVEEAPPPWFPPILRRELASAPAHIDAERRHVLTRSHGRARRHRAGQRRGLRSRSAPDVPTILPPICSSSRAAVRRAHRRTSRPAACGPARGDSHRPHASVRARVAAEADMKERFNAVWPDEPANLWAPTRQRFGVGT